MPNGQESSSPNMAARMPAMAEEFVQACKNAGMALDYLPRTLPLVDKFLTSVRAEVQQMAARKDPQASAIWMKNALWMAGYLGEVIRRETAGIWFEADKQLLIDIGTGNYATPLVVVQAFFEGSPVQAGDVRITSMKAYCEFICRQQQQWLDKAVRGSYASMTELRTSMTSDAKLAGFLLAQAQTAVQTAKLRWNEALDFSGDSLDAIEGILGTLHDMNAKAAPGEGATDEQIATMAKLWGVYLGEVLRRRYGGQWSLGENGVLELTIGGATVFPVGKARKRIVDGPADNVKFYFNAMAKVIS
jgi:hypothetical protein